MSYAALLKTLRGSSAKIEVAHPSRNMPEVVGGLIWDVLFEDKIALVITWRDENILRKKGQPPIAGIQGVPDQPGIPDDIESYKDLYLKWLPIEHITGIETDADTRIYNNFQKRQKQCKSIPVEPLYGPNMVGHEDLQYWSVLNNMAMNFIKAKLDNLGIPSIFEGAFFEEIQDKTGRWTEYKRISKTEATKILEQLKKPATPPPAPVPVAPPATITTGQVHPSNF